jgi:addiction module RelE/StbE family toxin
MRKVAQTRQFSRDLKRIAKRGKDLDKLKRVVSLLAKDEPLEPRHRDHAMTGNLPYRTGLASDLYTVDDESLRRVLRHD